MVSLYSYTVARDYGFAPNPFFGVCTLATCMHTIRSHAAVGDWVVGTGSARYGLRGRLVYWMRVEEVLSYDQYWKDVRFSVKKPNLGGSLKQLYGDNIYHRDAHGRWRQEDSHHSLPGGKPSKPNISHDTKANRVLVSRRYCYWGAAARELPSPLDSIVCPRRNYVKQYGDVIDRLESWIDSLGEYGCLGEPCEFSLHARLR